MASHVATTYGGAKAHWMRRLIHISLAIVPVIYYDFGHPIAEFLHLPLSTIVIAFLLLFMVLEAIRLGFQIKVFGQRHYELGQISAFTWGAVSLCLVLLLAPGKQFGIPIIWGCAFGDPYIGELRRFGVKPWRVFVLSVFFLLLLWSICVVWLGTPWWMGLVMAPITAAVEWPNLKWLDDNATMQLVPLLLVLFFHYSFMNHL